MEDTHKQAALFQDHERAEMSTEGYRRLQELRVLRAGRLLGSGGSCSAAAQMPLQGLFPLSPRSNSSSSSSSAPGYAALQQLSRSTSLDQPPPVPPMLRRSISISTDRAPLPPPQRLSRSSSAGTHSFTVLKQQAATGPAPLQQQQQQQQPPFNHPYARAQLVAAGAAAAAAAGGGAPSLSGAWAVARQPARHSEPGGTTSSDPLVDMLLNEVESLLAERQQLAARCCSLQRDNEHLAELVGRLSLALQDQQDQQQLGGGAGGGGGGGGAYAYGSASTSLLGLLGPVGAVAGQAGASGPSGHPHHHSHHHHTHHTGPHQQLAQRQYRVSQWLERRNTPAEAEWTAWQERLPLEHMHSGSSSTLTVALDQQ